MDYAGFPAHRLPAGDDLWSIHRAGQGPRWFSADGTQRFDPIAVAGQGTCYLATGPLGAFVEAFRTPVVIDGGDVEARRIARAEMLQPLRLADLTARRALRFGVTAEHSAGADYGPSQALASDLLRAGFDGILWRLRHDLEQELLGAAVFGPAGAPRASAVSTARFARSRRIGAELLNDARREFGYIVLGPP